MKIVCLALFFILASLSCNHSQRTAGDIQEAISPDTGTSWKFGIALWTFHDVNFPQSLDRVKQSGLTYIEPNTFHKTGAAFGDTMVGNLSLQGLEKLRNSISEKGLVCESGVEQVGRVGRKGVLLSFRPGEYGFFCLLLSPGTVRLAPVLRSLTSTSTSWAGS